ncbi:hypothetical protein ASE08_13435 [Rhizobacter sp. Root16D2]|nr:hypothetical protein ASC88_04450 [Rhizobacter sp. Root29]KQV98655.1 hypothetical protein ASC98_08280 [Rhizobacter sp. Root1238]KRB04908.1 hypothetical protein ASE08_13435 [Rhizobacter sp. Root16D2]
MFALGAALVACGGSKGDDTAASPEPQMSALSISRIGQGSVVSTPNGIDCGTDCAGSYSKNSNVSLHAAAAQGSQFVGWSGVGVDCAGTADCSLMLDQSKSLVATFSAVDAPEYALGVTIAGSGTVAANATPFSCSTATDCGGTYAAGTVVTLTATPASGYAVGAWSGSGVSCSGSSCQVTMSAARSISVSFTAVAAPTYALGVTVTGSGTVGSSPAGISCGSTCAHSYDQNTVVTLTATPASGYSFSGWSGAGCSGTNTCVVTMSAARAVAAAFAVVPASSYALTTTVTGTGQGTLVSNPSGINCPTACSSTVASGTSVTLTATSGSASHFSGWTGACASTGTVTTSGGTCTVKVGAATQAGAAFALNTYTLTVVKQGSGSVASTGGSIACGSTCSASFNAGTAVTLTATPASGYTFSNWTGACTGTSSTCQLTMNAAGSATAVFTAVPTVALTVTTTGSGSVGASPAGTACGTGCSSFASGTSVTLTATPASGYTFTAWGGACSGSSSTCAVSMTAAKSVSATFTATSTGGGGGNTSGKSWFVATTGSDGAAGTLAAPFKTLTKAVGVATAGDIIEVRAGTYSEAVVIRTAGTSTARITMRGYNGERPVIQRTGTGPTIYFYNSACDEDAIGTGTGNTDCFASWWTIQGLEVRGSTSGGDDGNVIKIDTAKVRIQGNTLCCSVADIVKLVRTANDTEVLDNEIYQNTSLVTPGTNAQGVDIVGANNPRVAGNYVHDVPDFGMYAKGNARNVIFENNLLYNIGRSDNGHAIMLGQETDTDRLTDGAYESYDGIVRNNVVVNATWACVATSSSSNVRIYNNSCYNTATTGQGSIFVSNESEIGTPGVNIEIYNNIIYGSAGRPVIKVNGDAMTDFTTLRIDGNIYWVTGGAPTFVLKDSSVSASAWAAQYKSATGRTDTSRIVDPKYASTTVTGATSKPLTLSTGSPAINTGIATSLVTTDYIGTARPMNGVIDVGAYEY